MTGVEVTPDKDKKKVLTAPIEKINVHVAGGNILPLQVNGTGGR